jgi:hypothetical protein
MSRRSAILLVAIAISDQPEHFQFPSRKVFVAEMLGQAGSHLGRYVPFTAMHRPDHAQQLIFRHALEHVGRSSRTHRPVELAFGV